MRRRCGDQRIRRNDEYEPGKKDEDDGHGELQHEPCAVTNLSTWRSDNPNTSSMSPFMLTCVQKHTGTES